jgi:hypothetical protein
MEDNRDWVEAQIAECHHQLSTLPESDWLGRVGFTHRLMRMKGILACIRAKENSEPPQNAIEILKKAERPASDITS